MSKEKTIHCYNYVNHPYDAVRDALSDNAATVFHDATKSATARAKSVASELRVNVKGISVTTDIDIIVHGIVETPKKIMAPAITRIELEWGAAKMPQFFPVMKAELSIYKLTATETQLDFLGNYKVPLGAVGSAMDALVGHRIAEASVHHFIKDVTEYLRTSLA